MTAARSDRPAALSLGPDVHFLRAPDGSGRLLDLGGGFFAVNAPGADLVAAAVEHDAPTAAGLVAARYGADPGRVTAALRNLLGQLRTAGLIRRPGRAGPRRWAVALVTALAGATAAHPGWLLAVAWVSNRLFGLPTTVAGFARARRPAAPEPLAAADARLRAATAAHPLPIACGERGPAGWVLASRAGHPARLVFGCDFYPFAAHCWCEADGRPLADFPDRCARYTPFRTYA